MVKEVNAIYDVLVGRYIRMVWMHKIQECQADIYTKKEVRIKRAMMWLNSLTTTSVFSTLLLDLSSCLHCGEMIAQIITTILAVLSTFCTFLLKEETYSTKAQECRRYAAKCRDLRSKYEALLSDIKSLRLVELDSIAKKREELENLEYKLFSQTIAPYTSPEAVNLAEEKLIKRQDNFISEKEIFNILPKYLQNRC